MPLVYILLRLNTIAVGWCGAKSTAQSKNWCDISRSKTFCKQNVNIIQVMVCVNWFALDAKMVNILLMVRKEQNVSYILFFCQIDILLREMSFRKQNVPHNEIIRKHNCGFAPNN